MKWLVGIVAAVAAVSVAALLFLAREAPASAVAVPADATAVLEDARFDAPAGWQWERLEIGGGAVRWGHAGPADPRAVVLFLPGYSAPLEIYFETFSRLVAEGYAVVGMDWPGQGGSTRGADNPQKIHATSLDGHVAAAQALSRELDRKYAGVPRLLVGLSMGAQLGTRLVSGSGRYRAAALVTPAYALAGGRPNAGEWLALNALVTFGFGERYAPGNTDWTYDLEAHNGVASDCSHPNDRTRLFYAHMVANEAVKVGGMSNAFAIALVQSGREAASDAVLSRIGVPVWMPLAGDDRFVDNAAARGACDAIADCRLEVYDEARHCLFEEADGWYEPFVADLIAFLDAHVGSESP